jgi:hypothetical protein
MEGFTRDDRTLSVKLPTPEAVAMLEGRWITPDPLATALNGSGSASAADIAVAGGAGTRSRW